MLDLDSVLFQMNRMSNELTRSGISLSEPIFKERALFKSMDIERPFNRPQGRPRGNDRGKNPRTAIARALG